MTQYSPTFNPQEFELRNYTDPYFTPAQSEEVTSVENRVSGELDFVAQMLGWSGPNYWSSLATTVSQKRQILGGTYGVYNSFYIPRIYEIRNWDETIVVDRVPFLKPGQVVYVENVEVGFDIYRIQKLEVEGDKYAMSLGSLPESFYTQIANNVPLRVDIPTSRPAPFYRPTAGASGDNSFICKANGTALTLYPGYDTQGLFPYLFPILFAGSVYYFNQPVYLTLPTSGAPNILPQYDSGANLWYLSIPQELTNSQAGIEGSLVWGYSDSVTQVNAELTVKVQAWVDPSDWNSLNVIQNYRGTWNNKGGALPFNFAFDSLSVHGYNEQTSLYLAPITRTLDFNSLATEVYSQLTPYSAIPPGVPNPGDLWWNSDTGVTAAWIPDDSNCGFWVEINYRQEPVISYASSAYIFTDVPSFIAGSGALPIGTTVTILDITGLSTAENVIGVQGSLTAPGSLTLYRADTSPYWTPVSFTYNSVADFDLDQSLLPYQIPVTVFDASGLVPDSGVYQVSNLTISITGDYEVVLTKYYNNTTWVISEDSVLKYIANSSLFSTSGYVQGEMWWDFGNSDPNTRAAAIYYQTAWVSINANPQSAAPAPVLDMSTILVYSDGVLLTDGVLQTFENYSIEYTSNPVNGTYEFAYTPITFLGKVTLPQITISDSLTTLYSSDITQQIFGGINYIMSPNVYDAETPLRLWKGDALQDAETLAHVAENNYVNPLIADLNNGPGPENWERYFVRLPLDYGRTGEEWQKTTLICQDFGYWGSTIEPEKMRCPPEDDLPAIYEELFLYDQPVSDYTYVYCEPYLYSNLAYYNTGEPGDLRNAGVFPATDVQFDEFSEAELIDYEPLHNRQTFVDVKLIDAEVKEIETLLKEVSSNSIQQAQELLQRLSFLKGKVYGDWVGDYVNVNPCVPLTGFYTTDLVEGGIAPVIAPVWDASIYKFAPTCANDPESYSVDSNHYKLGYAYFVADASAAEDGFFDPQQEAAWRFPVNQPKTLYVTPR